MTDSYPIKQHLLKKAETWFWDSRNFPPSEKIVFFCNQDVIEYKNKIHENAEEDMIGPASLNGTT
jgi:hypothetical protein